MTNALGQTDTWVLTIGDESRTGSLFELRRILKFYRELGVIPEVRKHNSPRRSESKTSTSRNKTPVT